MTYRAKIDKRLIIRWRHPNWRVVAPMHKKRMKSKCHRHLWHFIVKFYFPMIGMAVIEKRLSKREIELSSNYSAPHGMSSYPTVAQQQV